MNTIIKRAKKHNRCPICKNEVYTIMQGEPFGSRWVTLKKEIEKNNFKIEILGCCYGDERDQAYYCQNCNKHFDKNMKIMK